MNQKLTIGFADNLYLPSGLCAEDTTRELEPLFLPSSAGEYNGSLVFICVFVSCVTF